MKKHLTKKYLCVAMATAMAACGLCACSGDAPAPKPTDEANVTVTVENGTGGGKYKAGDECSVTAYVPRGYQFVEWQNYGYPISYDNPYKFDVDFDISLTAVIEKLPVAKYTVRVDGGFIGDGGKTTVQAEEGEKITLTPAESQSRKFKKWVINDEFEYTEKNAVITVTGETVATAVYDEYCLVAVNGGTVNGERSALALSGSKVTLTAQEDTDKQKFEYWYTYNEDYSQKILSDQAEYEYTLSTSLKVYAKYTTLVQISVTGGTEKVSGQTTAHVKSESECVLVADPDVINEETGAIERTFVGWYKGDTKLSIKRELTVTALADAAYTAKFAEVQERKMSTPATGFIYKEESGALALDRVEDVTTSMFKQGAAYVKLSLYASANTKSPFGELRMFAKENAGTTEYYMSDAEGKKTVRLVGEPGNLSIVKNDYSKFEHLVIQQFGESRIGTGRKVFFEAQLVSDGEVYINMDNDEALIVKDSDVSARTAEAIAFDVARMDMPAVGVNKMLYDEGNGTLAIDRANHNVVDKSNFAGNVDYVNMYLYTSPDADKSDYKAIVRIGMSVFQSGASAGGSKDVGWVALADGSGRVDCITGEPSNYYCHKRRDFNGVVKKALGDNYDSSQAYYSAFQAVPSISGAFLPSEITAIQTNGNKF